jgi:transposase
MAKYSFELKKKIVLDYEDGKGGYGYLAKKYGIPNKSIVKKWVNAYQILGFDGLLRSRKKQIYSFEFKLHIVELYLTSEMSYQELASDIRVNNPALLCKWVNDFQIAGPDALKPKKRGRSSIMEKPKKNSSTEKENSNINSEYLGKLEEENLKLRIENAYLKELRRQRLEGISHNKKQEQSTASEDSSN